MRRNIFNEFNDLKHIMNNFFNSNISNKYVDEPLVNLFEKDDKVAIEVLAPGVKNEDINLELTDKILKISINKKNNSGQENTKYLKRERNFGTFTKSIKLPYKVDSNSIVANLENGILKIEMSQSEESKPKKITIQ